MMGILQSMVGVLLFPTLKDADLRILPVDVPRRFEGTFEWTEPQAKHAVVLQIDKIELKDGMIHFSGSQHYQSDGSKVRVDGTIDPKKRTMKFRESDPSRLDAIVDGQFEGVLAEDLRSLDAVWTTRSNQMKGELKLEARKNK